MNYWYLYPMQLSHSNYAESLVRYASVCLKFETIQTNPQWQKHQGLPGKGQALGAEELGQRGSGGRRGDGDVPYLDCSDGLVGVYASRQLSDCILKCVQVTTCQWFLRVAIKNTVFPSIDHCEVKSASSHPSDASPYGYHVWKEILQDAS